MQKLVRNSFIVASFVGQAASFGKVYLSHILAVPYFIQSALFIFKDPIPLRKKYYFWYFIFLGWILLTLTWNQDRESVKYTLIHAFGFIQYSSFAYKDTSERKGVLLWLLPFMLLDVLIGIGETQGLWRFPLSGLNPDVINLGKTPIIGFQNLPPDSIEYLKTVPTGLRWGPNNFIISCLIFLIFMARFTSKKKFVVGLCICTVLSIYASSRLIFWLGFPIVSLLACHLYGRKQGLLSLCLPFVIAFLLTQSTTFLKYKSEECLFFPVKILRSLSSDYTPTKTQLEESFTNPTVRIRSEIQRMEILKRVSTNFINSPIIGQGPGKGSRDSHSGAQLSPHFYMLELLADFGIVGAILFLLAIVIPLKRIYLRDKNIFALALAISSILALGSVTLSSLVYFPLFYLSLGFIHSEIYSINE